MCSTFIMITCTIFLGKPYHSLRTVHRHAKQLFLIYNTCLRLFSRYSGGLYVNAVSQTIDNFDVLRYVLVALCFFILILSFFMLIRPTTLLLARTINQANSMMLLLPPQIVHKEIQVYITENMSSD